MRSILHVDMNNFYASVECLDKPELRHVPMAVAGSSDNRHGILLAKDRKSGVQGKSVKISVDLGGLWFSK